MTLLTILGPAAIPTLICLAVGLIMLIIELFTPGFGVSGIVGLICLATAILMQFIWGNPQVATYLLAIVLLVVLLAILWFVRSFQRGKLSRSFLVLNDSIDSVSTPDVAAAKADLIGKTGVTITPLRPSGIAQIESKRLDVMATGTYIEANVPIEIVNAEGMHILVRELSSRPAPAETAENVEAGDPPETAQAQAEAASGDGDPAL